MRLFWTFRRQISSVNTTNFKLPTPVQLNHLLQLCSNSKALNQGKQAHQQIIINGLQQNYFMSTKLVQMYADCNKIEIARRLFDKLSEPNVFAWTAIIAFYSRNGIFNECIFTYKEMKLKGVLPDNYVFPKALKACAVSLHLEVGIQLHKDVIVCGVESNVQVCNALIDMYSKCGELGSGRLVFDLMVGRDLLSWNAMISGYVYNEFAELAVGMLGSMRLDGMEPDIVAWNSVMDAYCRMGQCDDALKIFRQIEEPTVISWTILISGYSRIGKHVEALDLFRTMVRRGKVCPDVDCLSSVLAACQHSGVLRFGQEIHASGIKVQLGNAFYKSAGPALVALYAKCGRTQDVEHVFGLMDTSDVVTWNAMILGFAELGRVDSAVKCFTDMQSMGIKNDHTTVSTLLPVCDLKLGKQIHAYIIKDNFTLASPVCNALIHMYAKCGDVDIAYSVFSQMESRDLVSWNTMIRAFGMNGCGQAAVKLLEEMCSTGVSPSSLTFASVLSACSHSGLVNEGLKIFDRMSTDFGFKPQTGHFTCLVDLLARAGQLDDAVDFIRKMPHGPDKRNWGSILAASLEQQSIRIGVLASEHLVHLEPENAGHYVTLSNLYAKAGRPDDAVRVRRLMESRGLVKQFGYSSVSSGS
ncbi:unnamed protein product [Coffea canephora]|uniref:Pentacotripeptide-repeat region of PRORP domain-containing protein n=1 Tax=Coffea canephora TaxID=49390 RepID=A0A068VC88_COFCA|nr:unnamed protein product [Coffea canephora]